MSTPDGNTDAALPLYLSPSQIKSLLTCSEQYRLERVLRAPSRPSWAAVGGSVVHLITEALDREAYARGEA